MHDQADELRQLVLQGGRLAPAAPKHGPYVVAVSSGKGGVGTTTMAVNLAAALTARGTRTVLVDGDFDRWDATSLCKLDVEETVLDVLAGTRRLDEVLYIAAGGLMVVPGRPSGRRPSEVSALEQGRLLSGVPKLASRADVVVIDAGSGRSRVVERFWNLADHVLVVATPDPMAIMDAYAAIKVFVGSDKALTVESLVNLAPNARAGQEVHARLARACRRFLGLRLETVGSVPEDPQIAEAANSGRPYVFDHASSEAARQLDRCASAVLAASQSRAAAQAGVA